MVNSLETQLEALLKAKPELYQIPNLESLPAQTEIVPSIPEMILEKNTKIKDILNFGTVFRDLYRAKLKDMHKKAVNMVASQDPQIQPDGYELNSDTLFELRRNFVPSLEDMSLGKRERDEARSRAFQAMDLSELSKKLTLTPEQVYQNILGFSAAYDEFNLREDFGKNEKKRGEEKDSLSAHNIYNIIISWNPAGISQIDFSRRVIGALRQMTEIGNREETRRTGKSDSLSDSLCSYLAELEKKIAPQMMRIGFNEKWEDNYEDKAVIEGVCIFKGGNNAHNSLLYCIDPSTNMLFFSAENNSARAVNILFDAHDLNGNQYVVLEGVLMNKEFEQWKPLFWVPGKELNPNLQERKVHLDLMLYYAARYSYYSKKKLFINMTEITGTGEYGPHEFLHYLPRLFPNVSYQHEKNPDPRRTDEVKILIQSKRAGRSTLYLQKDNSQLQKILEENDVKILPKHLIDGKLKLMAHTWADYPINSNTWENTCEGPVYGIIVSDEEMRKILGM